jgi:hypothetical protein
VHFALKCSSASTTVTPSAGNRLRRRDGRAKYATAMKPPQVRGFPEV